MFTVDQLIDALLPDADPERAASNIRARVSELRGVLEPDLQRGSDSQYIKRIGEGYAFTLDSDCWVDFAAFESRLTDAQRAADAERWEEAVELFEAALNLYRGEFLAEDRYAEWAENMRTRLRRQYLDGIGSLASCYARLDRSRDAVSCCQRALAVDPCDEGVARQLMRLLDDAGQQAQAVRVHRRLTESLRRELDVEPSQETQLLFHRISQREPVRGARFDPCRLAIIPFVNVGSDPESAVLADGVTEELIYALSKVSGLEVIAQTTALKYKGSHKSVAEIGRELRVGTVLEGSAQRAKHKARVLVQLIDVESEAHLWAEQYDRTMQDILSVQGDVARRVASALEVRLLPREENAIRREEAFNSRVHTAYARGRFFLAKRNREGYEKAIACFEEALAIAPAYARALTGLADAHSLMVGLIPASEGFPKAKALAEQALAIDPQCAEAHATLGYVLWMGDGNVHEAERTLLRSIELNPNYAQARAWYAGLLEHTGRLDEACRQSEEAVSLDPLSAPLILVHASSLHAARRLAEAVDQYRRVLEIDPELESAWFGLWYSHAGAWDWERAEAVTREIVAKHPHSPYAYVNLSTCVMNRGRLEEGLAAIRKALELEPEPRRAYVLFHAGMRFYYARDYDTAIDFFQQTLERNPRWNPAHLLLAKCYMYMPQPRLEQALDEIEAAERAYEGADPFWQVHVHMDRGKIYARRGETDKAEKELAILLRASGQGGNRRIAIAGVLGALERVDEAFD